MGQENLSSTLTNFHAGVATGLVVGSNSLNSCEVITLDVPNVVVNEDTFAPPWTVAKLRQLVSLGPDAVGQSMPMQVVINQAINGICDILQDRDTKTCLFCGTEKGVCSKDDG